MHCPTNIVSQEREMIRQITTRPVGMQAETMFSVSNFNSVDSVISLCQSRAQFVKYPDSVPSIDKYFVQTNTI